MRSWSKVIFIPDHESKHVTLNTAVLCLDRLARKSPETDTEVTAAPVQDDPIPIDQLSEIAIKRGFALTVVRLDWQGLQAALSAGPILLVLRNQNVVLTLPAKLSSTSEIVVFDPLYRSGEDFFLPRHVLEPEWDGDAILVNKPPSVAKYPRAPLFFSALGFCAAAAVSGLVLLYPRASGNERIALTAASVATPARIITPLAADSEPEVSRKPPTPSDTDALKTASGPNTDMAAAESMVALTAPPSAAEPEPGAVKTASAPKSDTAMDVSTPGPAVDHSTTPPEPDALTRPSAPNSDIATAPSITASAAAVTPLQPEALTTASRPNSEAAPEVSTTTPAAPTVLKPDALETPRAPDPGQAAALLTRAPATAVTVLKPARLKVPPAPNSNTAAVSAPDTAAAEIVLKPNALETPRAPNSNPAAAMSTPPPAAPAAVPEADALKSSRIPEATVSRKIHSEVSDLAKPLSLAEIAALIARADALLSTGDLTSARLFYERAADGGSGQAALRLGETYDPVFLERIKLSPVRGDAAIAISWYHRAHALGVADADVLLQSMHAK